MRGQKTIYEKKKRLETEVKDLFKGTKVKKRQKRKKGEGGVKERDRSSGMASGGRMERTGGGEA